MALIETNLEFGTKALMSKAATVCEQCGAPANVHITDLAAGVPGMRHLCRLCADDSYTGVERVTPRVRSALAAVIITVGLYIVALSTLADILEFGGSAGFGLMQSAGLIVAGIILLLGAITKAPALLIIGLITGVLALLADWLAFGSSTGFGWQQKTGTVLGLALTLVGVAVARLGRSHRPRSMNDADE